MANKIGKKIKELRESVSWNQTRLANELYDKFEVPWNSVQTMLNQLESGKKRMNAKWAIMLSEVLGLTSIEWMNMQRDIDLEEADEEIVRKKTVVEKVAQ